MIKAALRVKAQRMNYQSLKLSLLEPDSLISDLARMYCKDIRAEEIARNQHLLVPDDKERLLRAPYKKGRDTFEAKYTGKCFCGSVKFELAEDPLDASYCHCRDCQRLHGAPYQWAAIFHKEAVYFSEGEQHLIFYNPRDKVTEYKLPCKISCAMCHGPIADEGRNMMLVLPGLIDFDNNLLPGLFRATHHMFYGSRVEDINDNIPKFLGKKGECEYSGEAKGTESTNRLAEWREKRQSAVAGMLDK